MEALRGLADDFNVRDPRKLYRLARQRDLDVTQAMAFQVQAPRPRALGKSAAEGPNDRLQADLIDFSRARPVGQQRARDGGLRLRVLRARRAVISQQRVHLRRGVVGQQRGRDGAGRLRVLRRSGAVVSQQSVTEAFVAAQLASRDASITALQASKADAALLAYYTAAQVDALLGDYRTASAQLYVVKI